MHVSDYKVFHQQNCRLCYTRQISNLKGLYSPKHSEVYSKLPKAHFTQLQFPSYDFTYWWYIRIISLSFLTKLEPWILFWENSIRTRCFKIHSPFWAHFCSNWHVSNVKVLKRVSELTTTDTRREEPHKFIFLCQLQRST